MTARVFNPFLVLLARLTDPALARAVQFLKAENAMLRKRLPRRVDLTNAERDRLFKLGESLGTALRELISIVTYRTFLRWKADRNGKSRKRCGNRHPRRTPEEVRELVIRMASENGWGYTRILGELRKLGIRKICRSTVRNILVAEGFDPGPKRGSGTWDDFIRIHWDTLWACDFFTKDVWTAFGKVTCYVLFFIEVHTRRVHVAGITPNPDGQWMAQTARNFRVWLDEEGKSPSYIVKDGDRKFTDQFDAILESTGATVKRISPRAPTMNPYAESWVGRAKSECFDRFVAFGVRHLEHLVRSYAAYYNSVRCHSGLDNQPVRAGPPPPDPGIEERDGVVCESWLGGVLRHYRRAA